MRQLSLLEVGVLSYPFNQNSEASEFEWNLGRQEKGLSYGRQACLMIQLVATAGWLRGMSRRRHRDVGAVWSLMEEGVRLCNSYHLWIRDPDSKTGFWPLARQRALEARLQDAVLAKRIAERTYLSPLDVEAACDPSHSNPVWEEREVGFRTEIQTLGSWSSAWTRSGAAGRI